MLVAEETEIGGRQIPYITRGEILILVDVNDESLKRPDGRLYTYKYMSIGGKKKDIGDVGNGRLTTSTYQIR